MKLPPLVINAAHLLYAMYAYSPFVASMAWYAQPNDVAAESVTPMPTALFPAAE